LSAKVVALAAVSFGLALSVRSKFSACALGIAAAAIVQWLAFKMLGKGSDYIVTKHLFGVVTMLVASCFVVAVSFVKLEIPKLRILASPAFAVAALFATICVFNPRGGFSVSNMVSLEKQAKSDPSIIASIPSPQDQFALEEGIERLNIDETFKGHLKKLVLR